MDQTQLDDLESDENEENLASETKGFSDSDKQFEGDSFE